MYFWIGLDPAGPLYNFLYPTLMSSDARFVDIVHTDYGFYGIAKITGTVDFFPNGGERIQPGCPKHPKFYTIDGIFSILEFVAKHITKYLLYFGFCYFRFLQPSSFLEILCRIFDRWICFFRRAMFFVIWFGYRRMQ